jgi:hypothetical protein
MRRRCALRLLDPDVGSKRIWCSGMEYRNGFAFAAVSGRLEAQTVQAGDKIVLVIHPMRDGTKGGLFVSATRLDGTAFGSAIQ